MSVEVNKDPTYKPVLKRNPLWSGVTQKSNSVEILEKKTLQFIMELDEDTDKSEE
jgi:hypothetical protein